MIRLKVQKKHRCLKSMKSVIVYQWSVAAINKISQCLKINSWVRRVEYIIGIVQVQVGLRLWTLWQRRQSLWHGGVQELLVLNGLTVAEGTREDIFHIVLWTDGFKGKPSARHALNFFHLQLCRSWDQISLLFLALLAKKMKRYS